MCGFCRPSSFALDFPRQLFVCKNFDCIKYSRFSLFLLCVCELCVACAAREKEGLSSEIRRSNSSCDDITTPLFLWLSGVGGLQAQSCVSRDWSAALPKSSSWEHEVVRPNGVFLSRHLLLMVASSLQDCGTEVEHGHERQRHMPQPVISKATTRLTVPTEASRPLSTRPRLLRLHRNAPQPDNPTSKPATPVSWWCTRQRPCDSLYPRALFRSERLYKKFSTGTGTYTEACSSNTSIASIASRRHDVRRGDTALTVTTAGGEGSCDGLH